MGKYIGLCQVLGDWWLLLLLNYNHCWGICPPLELLNLLALYLPYAVRSGLTVLGVIMPLSICLSHYLLSLSWCKGRDGPCPQRVNDLVFVRVCVVGWMFRARAQILKSLWSATKDPLLWEYQRCSDLIRLGCSWWSREKAIMEEVARSRP